MDTDRKAPHGFARLLRGSHDIAERILRRKICPHTGRSHSRQIADHLDNVADSTASSPWCKCLANADAFQVCHQIELVPRIMETQSAALPEVNDCAPALAQGAGTVTAAQGPAPNSAGSVYLKVPGFRPTCMTRIRDCSVSRSLWSGDGR